MCRLRPMSPMCQRWLRSRLRHSSKRPRERPSPPRSPMSAVEKSNLSDACSGAPELRPSCRLDKRDSQGVCRFAHCFVTSRRKRRAFRVPNFLPGHPRIEHHRDARARDGRHVSDVTKVPSQKQSGRDKQPHGASPRSASVEEASPRRYAGKRDSATDALLHPRVCDARPCAADKLRQRVS
jgi:hypothetical protein